MMQKKGFLLLEFIMAFYIILMTLEMSIYALNRYHVTQHHIQSITIELDNADNTFNLLLAKEPLPPNNKLQFESDSQYIKYRYHIENQCIQLMLPKTYE